MNGFTFFVRTWGLRLKTAKIAKKIPRAKINKGIFISVNFESSQTENRIINTNTCERAVHIHTLNLVTRPLFQFSHPLIQFRYNHLKSYGALLIIGQPLYKNRQVIAE